MTILQPFQVFALFGINWHALSQFQIYSKFEIILFHSKSFDYLYKLEIHYLPNIYLICKHFVRLPSLATSDRISMKNNLQKTTVSKNNGLQRLFTYYFHYVSNNSNRKKGIRARNKLFPRYCFLIDLVRTHESISASPRFFTKTFATVMNNSRNT